MTNGRRRRFNGAERAAIYLAADGKCALCGRPLEPGWHADHIDPYSAGGATDVVNGQALCPTCNLQKGSSTSMTDRSLRAWQIAAKEEFADRGRPQDFTVSATPGAGKTTFSLDFFADLHARQRIERCVVVVPTDSLRTQWCDAAARMGIDLRPGVDATDFDRDDYHGIVVTYQQLKAGSQGAHLARRLVGRHRTLVVLDEIHHAGEQKSWGDGLKYAFESATHRLMLTGTPWRRSSDEPIPFVSYTDGVVDVDYAYEYGRAVSDGVCRRVVVEAYDCETVRWIDCGKVTETSLNDELRKMDVPAVLDAVYSPSSEWMSTLLRSADEILGQIRTEIPDAAGLVVCKSQYHAREYAKVMRQITGESPAVVISDDGAEAKETLDQFKKGRGRWIVAVDMVSEGVDIPRLAVGVYASRKQTPLFFRQVVGRLVRARPNEEINATLFIPGVPDLKRHAKEIEDELRHQLELDREQEAKERADVTGSQREFHFREPLSATDAIHESTIISGDALTQAEIDVAETKCRENGLPVMFAPNIARMLRLEVGPEVAVKVEPQQPRQSKHRVEKQMRGEIKSLIGRIERRESGTFGWLNGDLLRDGWTPRGEMTIEQLEELRAYLARRLSDG